MYIFGRVYKECREIVKRNNSNRSTSFDTFWCGKIKNRFDITAPDNNTICTLAVENDRHLISPVDFFIRGRCPIVAIDTLGFSMSFNSNAIDNAYKHKSFSNPRKLLKKKYSASYTRLVLLYQIHDNRYWWLSSIPDTAMVTPLWKYRSLPDIFIDKRRRRTVRKILEFIKRYESVIPPGHTSCSNAKL